MTKDRNLSNQAANPRVGVAEATGGLGSDPDKKAPARSWGLTPGRGRRSEGEPRRGGAGSAHRIDCNLRSTQHQPSCESTRWLNEPPNRRGKQRGGWQGKDRDARSEADRAPCPSPARTPAILSL